jgi:hypothetical protein
MKQGKCCIEFWWGNLTTATQLRPRILYRQSTAGTGGFQEGQAGLAGFTQILVILSRITAKQAGGGIEPFLYNVLPVAHF